eukprot:GFUD01007972.1.p1 GENE.GFUD01007972.1~~GFUD01007972.1.p1  ORF type:complete len:416 (+),score=114.41 GFUD01007972.1:113-1360(+)
MVCYDVLVVGGGVVGSAVARELATSGKSVVLCEKEDDLLAQATSGNTGHLASNFYYRRPRALLEAEMAERARRVNQEWLNSQPAVPCIKRGMIYLAKGKEEECQMRELLYLGQLNKEEGLRIVSLAEVAEMEPFLCLNGVTAALFSANEAVVDPWLLAMTHVYGMEVAGVKIHTGCEVIGVKREGEVWMVTTRKGIIKALCVVNCGGNFGDEVEKLRGKESSFKVQPGKGEYVVFATNCAGTISRPVVPVPTKKTAGLYVFETVYGHTVVGPTNVRQSSKTDRLVSALSQRTLLDHIHSLYPSMRSAVPLGLYAGLRPATQHQDYCIDIDLARGWVTVGGIRSTGLTCSLAISQYIAEAMVPNYHPATLPTMPVPQVEGDMVRIGSKLYRPTHPLCRLGLLGADLPQQFVKTAKM